MTFSELFPSRYLRAADVGIHPTVLCIQRVRIEQVGKKQKTKLVCHFDSNTKPLILDKTNFAHLIIITGSEDFHAWAGELVVLFRDRIFKHGQLISRVRLHSLDDPINHEPSGRDDKPVVSTLNA